jgi:hypothetical protein
MNQCDHVSIITKANVYFDGKCVSHTFILADGSKKSAGVILAGTPLTFNTGVAERMEIVDGRCRVNIANTQWQTVTTGESFEVPANTRFEIEALDNSPVHYVCHFG